MSYTEHPLPDPLPVRSCQGQDLLVDVVYDGREYDGHNGMCMNCNTSYNESDDSDLSNTHWMHTKKVRLAVWERDTDPVLVSLCRIMDPDDPDDATDHAETLLLNREMVVGLLS
jgi:hypothetical protein